MRVLISIQPSMLVGLTAAAIVFASGSVSAQTGYPTTGDVRLSSFVSFARGDDLPRPHLALVADRYDAPEIGINVTRVAAAPAPPPAVRRECTPRYMAGPGLGIPLGLGTAVTGVVFVGIGTSDSDYLQSFSNSPGWIAGGSVMIAAGLASFLYSSVKLSKNRRERERVCGRRSEKPSWRR